MAVAFKKVPIIDFSSFSDPTQRIELGKSIRKACEDVGFLYITNHNVSEAQMIEVNGNSEIMLTKAKVLEYTHKFFNMSESEKMKNAKNKWNPSNKSTYRGYFPVQENAITSYKEGVYLITH